MTDFLARSCDVCGHEIGGGYKHCPKCHIYFCLCCSIDLQNLFKKVSTEVPHVRRRTWRLN